MKRPPYPGAAAMTTRTAPSCIMGATGPGRSAPEGPRPAIPPERKRMRKLLTAVAAAALAFGGFVSAQEKPKPIRVLLVCGGCCHDYAKQKDIVAKGLAERANVEVTIAFYEIKENKGKEKLNPVYEKGDWSKDFDVVIHDECDASVKDETAIA